MAVAKCEVWRADQLTFEFSFAPEPLGHTDQYSEYEFGDDDDDYYDNG